MKRILVGVLSVFGLGFADEILLQQKGYSTYIQEEEFMVAEGENVIGPVFLLPIAQLKGVSIKGENLKVKSFLIEGDNRNWIDVLKGQLVSIEGEGRFIKGEVVEIKNNRIMVDTRKGYVITTLPEFPSKLSTVQKWRELFSPKITFKVEAKEAKTEKFRILYPIKGINWKVNYVLTEQGTKKYLKGYIVLSNKTPLSLSDINIKLFSGEKIVKELKGSSLPRFSKKEILFTEGNLQSINLSELPDGEVSIYKNEQFKEFKKLQNGVLK